MTTPTRLVADGGYTALGVTSATNYNPNATQTLMTVYRVIVNVSANAVSYVIDVLSGTTQTAGNTILTIPANTAAGTIYELNWPCILGLALVPGSGVTLAASYSVGNQG